MLGGQDDSDRASNDGTTLVEVRVELVFKVGVGEGEHVVALLLAGSVEDRSGGHSRGPAAIRGSAGAAVFSLSTIPLPRAGPVP